MTIEQKIALVTGASRGIGRAIALTLAKQNIEVIGTATTGEGVQAINQMFTQAGVSGYGKVLDVTQSEFIEPFVHSILNEKGSIHILVNNAGITRDNLFLRMQPAEWHEVINTNLNALFYLTQGCIKGMIKQRWGRIINISSVVGFSGNAGQVNYCAAKAGIIGFTKSLALEVATRGITVNAVAPGFIETSMTQKLNEQQREALLQHIPMKQVGSPEDIAAGVAFLASEEAHYITGQTLHINGGLFMV